MKDDLKLLASLRERSPEAFQALFELYSDKMYRLAVSIVGDENDAEDVVQETFIKFFEKIETFEGRSSIGTWLYRVTHNASIDRVRRKNSGAMLASDLPEVEEGLPMPERIASWDVSVTAHYEQQELVAILDAAMQTLPEKLRAAFFLRDIEEMSTEEAAEVLEITSGAVKVRLHRARLLMREQLTAVLGDAVQRN